MVHTALNSHELDGQVPETIVLGQTANILPIVKHGFFNWVKWYNSEAKVPEPKKDYGRSLDKHSTLGLQCAQRYSRKIARCCTCHPIWL